MFRHRVDRHGENRVFCDVSNIGPQRFREVYAMLKQELGSGWGHVTVLHLMTDLGIAVKPDLHLVRATRAIGLHDCVSDQPTENQALVIV